jgi:hypothetical protein
MSKNIKRSSDWLSHDLCFKDLGFLIVLIAPIGVLVSRSNPRPLNPPPKADWHSRTPIGFRSRIISPTSMGSSELDKHIQWSKIEKQGHKNNAKSENLIAMWCRSIILRILYSFKKDIGVEFQIVQNPKRALQQGYSNLQENSTWIK